MNEFDYYLIDRMDYPAFDFKDSGNKKIFFMRQPIQEVPTIEMCLLKPLPTKIEFVDFHSAASILAFGEKLYNLLNPIKMSGVQFIPAVVEGKMKQKFNYWLMHNYSRIECMDLNASDCEIDKYDDVVWIRKIVLSPEKLAKVPLEERLFFRMKEDFPTHLVHKSIVDKILEQNPEGIKFTPVEEWKQGNQFK